MNNMLHEEYTNFLKTVEKLRSVRRVELLVGHIENFWSTYAGIGRKIPKTIVADDAFCMFISIFLNEWFAEALHDSIQRKIIADNMRKLQISWE